MARVRVLRAGVVREAEARDVAALLGLWAGLLAVTCSPGRPAQSLGEVALASRIEAICGSPDRRLLVAEVDHLVVGAAYLAREALTPLHDDNAVRVSYLHVQPERRRQGIGLALLDGAAAWAAENGAEHLVVDIVPQARDAHRYLARLGMRPVVTQRSMAIASWRRRRASAQPAVVDLIGGTPRRSRPATLVTDRPRQAWRVAAGR